MKNYVDFKRLDYLDNPPPLNKLKDTKFLTQTSFSINSYDNIDKKHSYKLVLMGILETGEKTCVIVNGIIPYVDVYVCSTQHVDRNTKVVRLTSILNGSCRKLIHKTRVVDKYPFGKYSKFKNTYLRVHFITSKKMNDFVYLNENKLKYEISSISTGKSKEDGGIYVASYDKIAAREYDINIGGWNKLKKGIKLNNFKHKSLVNNNLEGKPQDEIVFKHKFEYCFSVDHSDINKIEYLPKLDRQMVAAWDIETYSAELGSFPKAENILDEIFVIGISFFWKSDETPFLPVVLSSIKSTDIKGSKIIYCKNEKELLFNFIHLLSAMKPDYVTGFNDSGFDWKYVLDRIEIFYEELVHLIQCELTYKWFYSYTYTSLRKTSRVKMEAGVQKEAIVFNTVMFNCVDSSVVLRKKHPKAPSKKLTYFLKLYNLQNKEDMPISEMFKIFKRYRKLEKSDSEHPLSLLNKCRDVLQYCLTDANSCQRLLLKVNYLNDIQEFSSLTYTSLFDGINKADSGKIENFIMVEATKRDYVHNLSSANNKMTATGGYVREPLKGLKTLTPNITDLLKKSKLLETISEAEYANVKEDVQHYVNTKGFNKYPTLNRFVKDLKERKGHIPYETDGLYKIIHQLVNTEVYLPVGVFDFKSLYPSIMMAYNLSPEKLVYDKQIVLENKDNYNFYKMKNPDIDYNCWCVRRDDNPENNQDSIYRHIQKTLMSRRENLKKVMKVIKKQMKAVEQEMKDCYRSDPNYKELLLKYNYYNSKQLSCKIVMNTIYGICGAGFSPMYCIELSAEICYLGKTLIQIIEKEVVLDSFKLTKTINPVNPTDKSKSIVYYGDTDSCFFSYPPRYYTDIVSKYLSGNTSKVDYGRELVERTIYHSDEISDILNKKMNEFTGNGYVILEYEKIFFPVVFVMKKKYIGLKHEKDSIPMINTIQRYCSEEDKYMMKNIHLSGLDCDKRDSTFMLKKVYYNLILEVLHVNNTESLYESILRTVRSVMNCDNWNKSDFMKIATYKGNPNKGKTLNKGERAKGSPALIKFSERMEERKDPHYPPPNKGEIFQYVIAKKGRTCDYKGNIINPKRGDQMEYYDYYVNNPDKVIIDMFYYVETGILGSLAQLLVYKEDLFDKNSSRNLKLQSKNYLLNYYKSFVVDDTSAEDEHISSQKALYRSLKKQASTRYKLKGTLINVATDYSVMNDFDKFTKKVTKSVYKNYKSLAQKITDKSTFTVSKIETQIHQLISMYKNLKKDEEESIVDLYNQLKSDYNLIESDIITCFEEKNLDKLYENEKLNKLTDKLNSLVDQIRLTYTPLHEYIRILEALEKIKDNNKKISIDSIKTLSKYEDIKNSLSI